MLEPIQITDTQRQALDQSAGGPIFVIDAASGEEMVILRAAAFESFSRDVSIAETYPAQDRALAAVWDDPELDVYNDDVSSSDA